MLQRFPDSSEKSMDFEWIKRKTSCGSLVPSDWDGKDSVLGMAGQDLVFKNILFFCLSWRFSHQH